MKNLIIVTVMTLTMNSYAGILDTVFSGSVSNSCKGKTLAWTICDGTVYPANDCASIAKGKQSVRLTPKRYEALKAMGYKMSASEGTVAQCAAIEQRVAKVKMEKRIKRLKNKGF